ncbi:MAG: hypothetical protein JWM71_1532, partial [Solirubrobacteraceae bacterium]|nr:hypothetical protein [Solirubrobacteraceae bacterium]
MRRRPSPSLVVSIIALVFSLAGTSVAAISFATNAGAVDHLSAVAGSSSVKHASGKLVAAMKTGPLTGKIPARFLDLGGVIGGVKSSFSQQLPVNDNVAGAPVTIGGLPGFGTLTVSCDDQSAKAGVEDPSAKFAFANSSGQTLNVARSVGNNASTVLALVNGTQDAFSITASNTFRDYIQFNGANYVVEGVERQ